jgi:hypothetical protein
MLAPPADSTRQGTFLDPPGVVQTTPDCSEGLRWHIMSDALTILPATLQRLQGATANTTDAEGSHRLLYRDNNRNLQPLNGRTLWKHTVRHEGASSQVLQALWG